ncbi:unnamed protein product, partial [Discosporangium mesarthrocarpum]
MSGNLNAVVSFYDIVLVGSAALVACLVLAHANTIDSGEALPPPRFSTSSGPRTAFSPSYITSVRCSCMYGIFNGRNQCYLQQGIRGRSRVPSYRPLSWPFAWSAELGEGREGIRACSWCLSASIATAGERDGCWGAGEASGIEDRFEFPHDIAMPCPGLKSRPTVTGDAAGEDTSMGDQVGVKASQTDFRVPRHVAFVLDGNGRWATERNLPRTAGHAEGALRAREVVKACRRLGVEPSPSPSPVSCCSVCWGIDGDAATPLSASTVRHTLRFLLRKLETACKRGLLLDG